LNYTLNKIKESRNFKVLEIIKILSLKLQVNFGQFHAVFIPVTCKWVYYIRRKA